MDASIFCIWLHCKRNQRFCKYGRTKGSIKFLLGDHCTEVEHAARGCLIIFRMFLVISVLDNLKDYAVRALVNAVDHLGTVAYKLTDLYEQQVSEVSTVELKVASLNQVLTILAREFVLIELQDLQVTLTFHVQQVLTCQTYTDKEGLRQQQMIGNATRHHKHYIVPSKDV